jgi:ATP-dependent RNA helicase DeaD
MDTFSALGLSREVLRSLGEMGSDGPTPVQARAIPCLLQGRDVVAQALTGTGKTAAYGTPLVERVDIAHLTPQSVVLRPTRELAVQVAEQLWQLGRYRGLQLVTIHGGQPYDRQLARARPRGARHRRHAGPLAGPPAAWVGRPRGRAPRCARRADQMLDLGFADDVEAILGHLPTERTTALFSATMPGPIQDLIGRYLHVPEFIQLSQPQALTAPGVDQVFYQVPFPRKLEALCRVLDARQPERAIVFCATKRMVDEAVERLQAGGYAAQALHGDISQPGREKVLRAFMNVCAHLGGPLQLAPDGATLRCQWHQACFDTRTGSRRTPRTSSAPRWTPPSRPTTGSRSCSARSGQACGAEAKMARLLASEASWAAANICLNTYGGIGFVDEHDVERKFRETRLYQVAPVNNNLVLAYVSNHVLGLPRSY